MRTKSLCFLIHIRIKCEVDTFLLFVFSVCLCHTVLCVNRIVVTYWERADLLALLDVLFSCVFCHFPMSCPWSAVVLYCIHS